MRGYELMRIPELNIEILECNISYINYGFPLESKLDVIVKEDNGKKFIYEFYVYNFNNNLFNTVLFHACWLQSIKEGVCIPSNFPFDIRVRYHSGDYFQFKSFAKLKF